jgi:hypothetical protein
MCLRKLASIWASSSVLMLAPTLVAFGASEHRGAYTAARVSMMQPRNAVCYRSIHPLLLCSSRTAAFNALAGFKHGLLLRPFTTEIAFA